MAPSTQIKEERLGVQDYLSLHNEFKASLGYMRPCFRKWSADHEMATLKCVNCLFGSLAVYQVLTASPRCVG